MDRIVEVGKKVWFLLTEDERDKYRVFGTLSFVDAIVDLLRIKDFDVNNIDLIESIHDQIFG